MHSTLKFFLVVVLLLGVTAGAFAQRLIKSFLLDIPAQEPGLASNSVSDIKVFGGDIWFGTNKGVSRTSDMGLSFVSFGTDDGIGRGGVSGLAVSQEVVWVATAFDTTTEFGRFQAGGGLAYSLDNGLSWHYVPQPGVTPVQNISFDVAIRDNEVWIASFGGGLRKSSDLGMNWEVVPPDSFIHDPLGNLNHRVFAVTNAEGVLWVGTAGGINRSTDGGETWTNFSHQNQAEPISGNFVVAIAHQRYGNTDAIWAATRETTSETGDTTEFRGVSWTEDFGFTWRTALRGQTVHNIAFEDSAVYAASELGLFKSIDGGETWAVFPKIESPAQNRIILSDEVFTAAVSGAGSTLWVGTRNGLARSSDNGATWTIFQVFTPTGAQGAPRTYAYPNPFSPNVHNQVKGAGHVRFQYNTINATRVTLKVYDFAMDLVTTVVENISRPANGDFYEIWDGRDSIGNDVDNGVYFYRIELDGDGSYWGKLMVLK